MGPSFEGEESTPDRRRTNCGDSLLNISENTWASPLVLASFWYHCFQRTEKTHNSLQIFRAFFLQANLKPARATKKEPAPFR